MTDDSKIFDWQGWSLGENPHGENFDLSARKRMLEGSRMLFPFFDKYKKEMGKTLLEVGPFFTPLITPKEFPDATIFFFENDMHVIEHLKLVYAKKNVYPLFCDLNTLTGTFLENLTLEIHKQFAALELKNNSFDSVVISHVFNYIDYALFLKVLQRYIKKDGLIFINNVVDYGLPSFFSERRPKSISETITTVKERGYDIIEKKIFASPNKKYQKKKRLILIAKRNEK